MPRFVYRSYGLLVFALGTALLAFILLLSPLRSNDYVIDPLNALVAAVMALTIYRRLQLGVPNIVVRAAWMGWLGILLLTLVLEWLPTHRDILLDFLSLKESAEFVLWLLAPIGLFIVSRFERVPVLVKHLLICGFVAQTLVVALEFFEDTSLVGLSADEVETISDFSQFVFLQFYLVAFGLLLLYAGWSPIARHAESDVHSGPLGNRARHVFDAYHLFAKGRFPKQRIAHWPGALPIIDFGRIVLWSGSLGGEVRRNFGVPVFRQVIDILLLMMHCGLDAQAYYMLELYRRDRQRKAGEYLTRYETKNGLFTALNYLIPKKGHRSNLSDKAQFGRLCAAHDLPVPRLIAMAQDGRVAWLDQLAFETVPGLFVKPAISKGARGTEAYIALKDGGASATAATARRNVPHFLSPEGKLVDQAALEAHLVQQSSGQNSSRQKSSRQKSSGQMSSGQMSSGQALLVQERLENAPSVARYAQASLVVIRIITCRDPLGTPAVTHGMLRILSKLEPDWPSDVEYGAPIDLASGALGWLTGDKRADALDFFDYHPVTGARVLGAVLPEWPAARDLALAAHRVFSDRFVIGWDIAVTPNGPVLIEGNAYPDFAFLQRVHRQPAGESPIGPLLHDGLDRLVAAQETAKAGPVRV